MSAEESWLSWWRGDTLSPSHWSPWSLTPEERVRDELQEFLYDMDGTVEAAVPMLLKILRDHGGEPATTLADMLDPDKKRHGSWS